MEAVAIPGEVSDLSDACLVDLLQMAPTADVLENLRDEDPERGFGAKAQAALLRCLRHLVVAHPRKAVPRAPPEARRARRGARRARRGRRTRGGARGGVVRAKGERPVVSQDVRPGRRASATSEHLPPRMFGGVARAHHRARFPEPVRGRDGVPRVGGRVFSRRAGREPRRRTLRGKRVVEIGRGGRRRDDAAALRARRSPLTLLDRDNETLTNLAANLAINGVPSRYVLRVSSRTRRRRNLRVRGERRSHTPRGATEEKQKTTKKRASTRRRRLGAPGLARFRPGGAGVDPRGRRRGCGRPVRPDGRVRAAGRDRRAAGAKKKRRDARRGRRRESRRLEKK